jgi:redox-sensitive bicupin YhaK (pirin superfamily)
VTFILEGELSHLDSGGHESIIGEGGVQWMTAGRGLVHAELSPERFRKRGGPLEILQLWVNLPAALKMTTPAYRGLQGDEIPTVQADAGRVRIEAVSGSWAGVDGAFASLTGVEMAVVRLAPGARIELPIASGRTVFFYVVRGEAKVGETVVPAFSLAELSDGDALALSADKDAVILLGHAHPIGEPVVAQGPFVMNSRDEIVEAIRDYQAGKFGGLS